jgi:hypothetical protein
LNNKQGSAAVEFAEGEEASVFSSETNRSSTSLLPGHDGCSDLTRKKSVFPAEVCHDRKMLKCPSFEAQFIFAMHARQIANVNLPIFTLSNIPRFSAFSTKREN